MLARARKLSPFQIALAVGLAVLIFASPFGLGPAFERFGTRGVAAVGVVWGASALAMRLRRGGGGTFDVGPVAYAAIAAFAFASVVTEDRVWLELLPAVIYVGLVAAFLRSLREPMTVIERIARRIDPKAPEFVEPYCRKLTVAWCAVFAVNAGFIAAFALTRRQDAWALWTGVASWGLIAALQVVEFFVRKLWFRNYTTRPYDRLLSRLFPAENTAQGRRSKAYIQEMRARIARGETVPGDALTSRTASGSRR